MRRSVWMVAVVLVAAIARPALGNPHLLRGHTNFVRSVAWSPDGKLLASWGQDNTVRVWDTSKREEIAQFFGGKGKDTFVSWASWNAAGTLLASLASDMKVRVIDVRTLKELVVYDSGGRPVGAFDWHPKGERIVSVSGNSTSEEFSLDIWEARTGKVERSWKLEWRILPSRVAWSPDGTRVATATESGEIRVWDPKADKPLVLFDAGYIALHGMAWNPDGKSLATCGYDAASKKGGPAGTAAIWDTATGKRTHTLRVHSEWTTKRLSWSPDSKLLAVSDGDRAVSVWSPSSGSRIWQFNVALGEDTLDFDWKPDSKAMVIVSDGRALIADAKTGRALWQERPPPAHPLRWRPDGLTLAGVRNHPNQFAVFIWELPKK